MTRAVKISEFAQDKTISDLSNYLMTLSKMERGRQMDKEANIIIKIKQ